MFDRKLILLSTILLFTPALANEEAARPDNAPPERISFLVAFGDEKCPEAGDEIIVCASVPEGDRYRIPVALRQREIEVSSGGSWTAAVESLDEFARAVRPNSCSVNGSNGFTGCTQAALRQWFAERRSRSNAN